MELYNSISDWLSELKEKKLRNKKIVLLTTGALNPIHIGHLNTLKIVEDNLINKGYEILYCSISTSSDYYLNEKKNWIQNFVYFLSFWIKIGNVKINNKRIL